MNCNELKRYYITFGNNPIYPYGVSDYVIVYAPSEPIAREVFSHYHSKTSDGYYRFASIYSEVEWFQSGKYQAPCDYYQGVLPKEIIGFNQIDHGHIMI